MKPGDKKPPRSAELLTLALIVTAMLAPLLAPYGYNDQHRNCILLSPCVHCASGPHAHWLGTDEFGRDQVSRLLFATRTSLLLSVVMAGAAMALAVPAALASAVSTVADGVLRVAAEIVRSLPWIFVLVAIRAALPLDSGRAQLTAVLVVLFASTSWALPAWGMRGVARDLMQRDFVQAASALGASRLWIVRRHIWPNLAPLAATYFALLFVAATLAEMSLAVVGLGVPDLPTWGGLIASLKNQSLAVHAWWLYAPFLCSVPLLAALNLRAYTSSAVPQH